MFVQSNPGVFPPAESNTHSHGATAAVRAMQAAGIDPADTEGYTMISFYGFRHIDDPTAFAAQLEQLWRPFKALGRVGALSLRLHTLRHCDLLVIATWLRIAGVCGEGGSQRADGGA